MADLESDAVDVIEAQEEASDCLQFAIQRFFALRTERRGNDGSGALSLVGMEFALLREAARMAQLQKELCNAKQTRAMFGKHAQAAYVEMQDYRGKHPRPKPKPKAPHLKVVKSDDHS